MTKLSLVLLLALTSCSATQPRESACLAKGGTIVAYTMFTRTCEWPAFDAGKSCKDNRECQGLCELSDSHYEAVPTSSDFGVEVQSTRKILIRKEGSAISGNCSAVQRDIKAPNCTAYVKDGRVALAGCAD